MIFFKNRKLSIVLLVISIMLFITSCNNAQNNVCNHSWVGSTCIKPRTCILCGITDGTPSSNHAYEGDKCKDCGIIKLTLSNYEDYIECNATVRAGDSFVDVYTNAICEFEATGNAHYKYNDVSIVIRFCHYDREGHIQYLANTLIIAAGGTVDNEAAPYDEATYTVKLNLAGNGNQTCKIKTPWENEGYAYRDTEELFDRTTFEIVSISGTVQEY